MDESEVRELEVFRDQLVERLTRNSHPESKGPGSGG
jgi:hypothetical protein